MIKQLTENVPEWQKRAKAAFDLLKQQPQCDTSRLAAIGYCFGGSTAILLAATGADLGAVVTFHAGLQPPPAGFAKAIKASIVIVPRVARLPYIGRDDGQSPQSARRRARRL